MNKVLKLRGDESGLLTYNELDLARGLYKDAQPLTLLSVNNALGNSQIQTIWDGGGLAPFPEEELYMTVSSDSLEDSFDSLGSVTEGSDIFTSVSVNVSSLNYLTSEIGIILYGDDTHFIHLRSGIQTDNGIIWGNDVKVHLDSKPIEINSIVINANQINYTVITEKKTFYTQMVTINESNYDITHGSLYQIATNINSADSTFNTLNHIVFDFISDTELKSMYAIISGDSMTFRSYVTIDYIKGLKVYNTHEKDNHITLILTDVNEVMLVEAKYNKPPFQDGIYNKFSNNVVIGPGWNINGVAVRSGKIISQLEIESGEFQSYSNDYISGNTIDLTELYGSVYLGKYAKIIDSSTGIIHNVIINNDSKYEIYEQNTIDLDLGFELKYTSATTLPDNVSFNTTTMNGIDYVLVPISTTDSNNKVYYLKDSGISANSTGARSIKISGLDKDYNIIGETIIMKGLSGVITSNKYFRINSLEVISIGEDGTNVGHIYIGSGTITDGVPSIIYDLISINTYGRSSSSFFTVPNGYTLYLHQLGIETLSDKVVEAYVEKVDQTGKRILSYNMSTKNGHLLTKLVYPSVIPGCSTVHMVAKIDQKDAMISAFMSGIMIKETLNFEIENRINQFRQL